MEIKRFYKHSTALSSLVRSLIAVDARIYRHPITGCLHGGREYNNENTYKCQHYVESTIRTEQCMYWCKDTGRCDCSEE